MDFERLQRIYEDQFIDRAWWGHFNISGAPVNKSFHTVNLVGIVAACAKLALHITGEIPRIRTIEQSSQFVGKSCKNCIEYQDFAFGYTGRYKSKCPVWKFYSRTGTSALYPRGYRGQRSQEVYPCTNRFLHMLKTAGWNPNW